MESWWSDMISVIIPCFDQATYLRTAVDSVFAQSRIDDVEVVIVNDASTDGTQELANRIAGDNPHVTTIVVNCDTNYGLSGARNIGIKESNGSYILPLDADDYLHPDCIARMAEALDKNPKKHIVGADRKNVGLSHEDITPRFFAKALLPLYNQFSYCSMYRRCVWEIVGGYRDNESPQGYEDWEFWLDAAEEGMRFVHIPDILWFYRVRSGSMAANVEINGDYMMARMVARHPALYAPESLDKAKEILTAVLL